MSSVKTELVICLAACALFIVIWFISVSVSVAKVIAGGVFSAMNDSGIESAWSPGMIPPKVDGFRANYSGGKVRLAWSPLEKAGVKGYRIYRGSSRGNELISGSANSTSFSDYDVNPGASYWYAVSAVNDFGESRRSVSLQVPIR